MKLSKPFFFTIFLLLLSTGPALAEEAPWSYPNSELAKHNLYDHFLQGNMKANILEAAKNTREEIELFFVNGGSPLAAKFLPDVSAIELSYLLYWFSYHKKAIENGSQPYWVKKSDLQVKNIKRLSENIRLNRQPGIITLSLLKIAEGILENSNYLDSGKPEQDIRYLFMKKLWCRQHNYSSSFLTRFIEQLETGNITSVIDEFAKNCEKSNINQFQVDTLRFRISKTGETTFLHIADEKKTEIPKDWLYPAGDVEKDKNSYVNSFNYLEPVTSFVIVIDGRTAKSKLIGIHISSWDCMPPGSGSAMAASGRDIFLIYNSATHKLLPGILDLGITKDRVRSIGCFFANFNSFYLGDVNGDGLTDLGIQQEKIWCDEETDEQHQIDFMAGHYYKKLPIRWYAFQENTWKRLPIYDTDPGIFRTDQGGYFKLHHYEKPDVKLPMIGMTKSPIEFAREIYKGKLKEVK